MHPDKWPEIKQKIVDSFEVRDQGEVNHEDRLETMEFIEFKGPVGLMRLEWITRPRVLGKKTHYSTRIGSDVGVDYIYSADEFTHTLKIFKWDNLADDWEEIDAGSFGL